MRRGKLDADRRYREVEDREIARPRNIDNIEKYREIERQRQGGREGERKRERERPSVVAAFAATIMLSYVVVAAADPVA